MQKKRKEFQKPDFCRRFEFQIFQTRIGNRRLSNKEIFAKEINHSVSFTPARALSFFESFFFYQKSIKN
jgi:hypothetical protein